MKALIFILASCYLVEFKIECYKLNVFTESPHFSGAMHQQLY